jgi:DNA invertase Pin-like site-specific DNA recombinase
MRAALYLCPDVPNKYGEYVELWSLAARNGLAIAGVFTGDCDELRQLIARRLIDVVVVWTADRLSRDLQYQLHATGCTIYAHQPGVPATAEAARVERVRVAHAKAPGKSPGRPRINDETEQAIRAALASGAGIRRVAREIGVGTSVVQRIKT